MRLMQLNLKEVRYFTQSINQSKQLPIAYNYSAVCLKRIRV